MPELHRNIPITPYASLFGMDVILARKPRQVTPNRHHPPNGNATAGEDFHWLFKLELHTSITVPGPIGDRSLPSHRQPKPTSKLPSVFRKSGQASISDNQKYPASCGTHPGLPAPSRLESERFISKPRAVHVARSRSHTPLSSPGSTGRPVL